MEQEHTNYRRSTLNRKGRISICGPHLEIPNPSCPGPENFEPVGTRALHQAEVKEGVTLPSINCSCETLSNPKGKSQERLSRAVRI